LYLLQVVWHTYTLTGGVSLSSCTLKPGGAAAVGNICGNPLAEYPLVLSLFRKHPRCLETFVASGERQCEKEPEVMSVRSSPVVSSVLPYCLSGSTH
jgi:hypothetical protein